MIEETTTDLPYLLTGDSLVEAITDTDAGEVLPNPFDGFIPPLVKGRASVLGGPTGVGKTVLGLQVFRYILDSGYKGAYVTLEMTPHDLFDRFKHQFDSDQECLDWLRETEAGWSQSYIDSYEIEQIIKQDYDLVVVDHVHELPYEDRLSLERKVRRLVSLAPATNTAVFLLAQLRRPDPQFPRPPSKHDFRETGVIEQSAASLLALYQEDEHSDEVEIYTLKNRFGPKNDPFAVTLKRDTITFERAW